LEERVIYRNTTAMVEKRKKREKGDSNGSSVKI
jgi:hypothetical protein